MRNSYFRIFFAEFLGTGILVVFGVGSVAQYALSKNYIPDIGFISVYLGFFVGVSMGVYVSAGVSGGHINPAVTLALALLGKVQWRKCPVYFIGQYLGGFTGAALVYGVYYDAFAIPGTRFNVLNAGIFATYPQPYVSWGGALATEIAGTAILLICILAVTDERNHAAPKGVVPLTVGLAVMGVGASFGLNTGFALNPARDLGPRVLTYLAQPGWDQVFTYNDYYFWIPIVGPHIGAIIGAVCYHILVGIHQDTKDENVVFTTPTPPAEIIKPQLPVTMEHPTINRKISAAPPGVHTMQRTSRTSVPQMMPIAYHPYAY